MLECAAVAVTTDLEEQVRSFFETWKTRDADGLLEYFAPGASWAESNRDPAVGHEAIRAVLGLQTSFARAFEFEIVTIGTAGRTVFAERTVTFVIGTCSVSMGVAGVFEFDDAGRIVELRDYYDWDAVRRQLRSAGIDASAVDRH